MPIRKKARHLARALTLLAALSGAALSCAALAGQPDVSSSVRVQYEGDGAWAGFALGLRSTLHPFLEPAEPFGLSSAPRPAEARQWRIVAAAIEHERSILAHCRMDGAACPPGAVSVLEIIEAARGKDGRARLGEVNRAVNLLIRYRPDAARHQAADVWASPLAATAAGEGDCEDYAILKYLALREAGVPADDLRFVLVRDTALEQDHAVLTARLEERWLVLDNRRFQLVEDGDAAAYRGIAVFGADRADAHLAADDPLGRPDAAPRIELRRDHDPS
jgi:predicted transglutaminase-like cysteine proteinase